MRNKNRFFAFLLKQKKSKENKKSSNLPRIVRKFYHDVTWNRFHKHFSDFYFLLVSNVFSSFLRSLSLNQL